MCHIFRPLLWKLFLLSYLGAPNKEAEIMLLINSVPDTTKICTDKYEPHYNVQTHIAIILIKNIPGFHLEPYFDGFAMHHKLKGTGGSFGTKIY